jgi:hypothetical protein
MDVNKASVMEKLVDGEGRFAARPVSGVEQIRPGPQVGDGAQKLHRMALFLQRVIRGALPLHPELFGVKLHGLIALGFRNPAPYSQGGAYPHGLGQFVSRRACVAHNLKVFHHRAVVQLDKSAGLHIPHGARPAAQFGLLADVVLGVMQQFFHCQLRHIVPLVSFPIFLGPSGAVFRYAWLL